MFFFIKQFIWSSYIIFCTKKDWLFISIIAFIYFILGQYFNQHFTADSIDYINLSNNLYQNFTCYAGDLNSETANTWLYSKRPPIYGWFIGPFTNDYIFLSFIQLIITLYSILTIVGYLRANNHFIHPLLFLLILLTPSIFIYANLIMAEVLFMFIITNLSFSTIKLWNYPSLFNSIKWAIWSIIACFTKPIIFPFILFISIVLLIKHLFKKINTTLFVLVIPIVVINLWSYRNYQKTGVYEFSSISKYNLLEYNIYYFLKNQNGPNWTDSYYEQIHKHQIGKNYREITKIRTKHIKQRLQANIIPYSIWHLKGAILMFIDPGKYDWGIWIGDTRLNTFSFLEVINQKNLTIKSLNKLNIPIFYLVIFSILVMVNLFKIIGFITQFIKIKEINSADIILLLFILYFAIVTGGIGASRFLIPIVPIYLLLCYKGIMRLLYNFK